MVTGRFAITHPRSQHDPDSKTTATSRTHTTNSATDLGGPRRSLIRNLRDVARVGTAATDAPASIPVSDRPTLSVVETDLTIHEADQGGRPSWAHLVRAHEDYLFGMGRIPNSRRERGYNERLPHPGRAWDHRARLAGPTPTATSVCTGSRWSTSPAPVLIWGSGSLLAGVMVVEQDCLC